jgi:hypothetical protein
MESNRDLTELIYAILLLIVLVVGTMISNQNNEGFVNFQNYAPVKYVTGACDAKVIKQGDGLGMARMYDMKTSRMSSFDGDKLFQPDSEPNRADKWRHSPSNLPLIKSPFLTSPVGEDIPITDDLVSAYYPKVDEDKDEYNNISSRQIPIEKYVFKMLYLLKEKCKNDYNKCCIFDGFKNIDNLDDRFIFKITR